MIGKIKTEEEEINRVSIKKIIRVSIKVIASVLLVLCTLFFMVYLGVFGHLDSVKELQNIQNYLSSEIYSHDKVLLGKYYLQDRTNVRYRDLPSHLIDALVAT